MTAAGIVTQGDRRLFTRLSISRRAGLRANRSDGARAGKGYLGGGAHQGAVAQQPSQGGEAWLGAGKIQGAKIQAQRLLSGCAQQDWAAKPGLLPCTQHFAHRSLRPEQPVAIGLGLRTAESHAAQSGML